MSKLLLLPYEEGGNITYGTFSKSQFYVGTDVDKSNVQRTVQTCIIWFFGVFKSRLSRTQHTTADTNQSTRFDLSGVVCLFLKLQVVRLENSIRFP